MPRHATYPLIAGLLSACLFLLVGMLGLGFFFLFLPTLPILFVGLGHSSRAALKAAAVASLLLILLGGAPAAVMFFVFLGFPAWYISDKGLLARGDGSERQWYPMGLIFLHLTLYACALLACITFYYTGQPGGIEAMLTSGMQKEFADVEGEYADMLTTLISSWAFLIFSITIWLWGLALYAHVWFAQRLLSHKEQALRPGVGVAVFAMPGWVLSLLAICALASLIGSPSLQFLGKSCLISLLLPYFLSGCAHMHKASLSWPNRRFFLFFVYFMVFAQFWPALGLSAVGIWQHIKALSSKGASATR